MDALFATLGPAPFLAALLIAVLAGVIKGMVGFGMPMVLISGLSTFLSPEWALAGLVAPTVVTNGFQALRHGPGAAVRSVARFRLFLLVGAVAMVVSAQFVRFMPQAVFLLLVGVPVTALSLSQLAGRALHLARPTPLTEVLLGGVTGVIGGFSGVWGPTTVAYLTALGTEKAEQVRAQGVIFGLGAIVLVFAHLGSGVLRAETIPFSLALVPPALVGLWAGTWIHDRIDQTTFRRATLVILLLAGLNLIRRALLG